MYIVYSDWQTLLRPTHLDYIHNYHIDNDLQVHIACTLVHTCRYIARSKDSLCKSPLADNVSDASIYLTTGVLLLCIWLVDAMARLLWSVQCDLVVTLSFGGGEEAAVLDSLWS